MATLLGAWIVTGAGLAHAKQARKLAILIVSSTSGPEPAVQDLAARTAELLTEVGFPGRVPLRYHFDKPAESRYCRQSLKISPADLPFIGVVTIDGRGGVLEVVHRLPRAHQNVELAAQEAVYRWRVLSGRLPGP